MDVKEDMIEKGVNYEMTEDIANCVVSYSLCLEFCVVSGLRSVNTIPRFEG